MCCKGAVACQLTEYLFPGSIPMNRINWGTKNSYEYVQNYKLLQAAFSKNRVQKYVDVDKLIRGKYQDNLEFCQWLKAFHDQQQIHGILREDYDPSAARSKGKGAKRIKEHLSASGTKTTSRSRRITPSRNHNRKPTSGPPRKMTSTAKESTKTKSMKNNPIDSKRNQSRTKSQKENVSTAMNSQNPVANKSNFPDSIVADAGLIKKNADLASKNAELELTLAEIEKERDFYFEKLRDVEILLQVHEENKESDKELGTDELLKDIFKVLYATTDDKVVVDDDGKVFDASKPTNDDDDDKKMECDIPIREIQDNNDESLVTEQEMF